MGDGGAPRTLVRACGDDDDAPAVRLSKNDDCCIFKPDGIMKNDATGALVRSCDANARSCAEYLASAAFDYVVSTGPRGAAKADILARCHPHVVHVRRPAAAAASS